jgi:hypothetical protein
MLQVVVVVVMMIYLIPAVIIIIVIISGFIFLENVKVKPNMRSVMF